MVKTVSKPQGHYYVCVECNFAYKDINTAKKCEDWCREHHSCSLEITKNVINTPQ